LGTRSGDNIPKAIAFYEQAIARDPNYALAYAGLAQAYILVPFYTGVDRFDAYLKPKRRHSKPCALIRSGRTRKRPRPSRFR